MSSIVPLYVSKNLLTELSQGRRKGTFHSAFTHCVNGLLEPDYVFSIIPDTVWLNPRCIQIAWEDWTGCRLNQVDPGGVFYVNEHTLYLPESGITVQLSSANTWDLKEIHLPPALPPLTMLKNLDTARRTLRERKRAFLFPAHYETAVQQRLLSLRKAIVTHSYPEIGDAVASLVGLGPGLTPACDDFLLGFMAAFHFFGRSEQDLASYGKKISALIASIAVAKTHVISQQMLQEGVLGRFSLPIIAVMEAVLAQQEEGLLRARCAELMGIGASSGGDILEGILWGIELVLQLKGE